MAHRLLAGVITTMLFSFTACSPEPVIQDLGHLAASGKPDFAGFDFNLPTIKKSGALTFSFSAEGSFELRLTQPEIASSKRAIARLILDDGAQIEETDSSRTPVIEWQADGDGLMSYTLTVKNRSTTRTLTARLVGEVLEPDFPYTPPLKRRLIAQGVTFEEGTVKVPVAFFDADSTLRISKTGNKTPDNAEDVMMLPGVATRMSEAVAQGHMVAIVSNQGGVHYNYITFEDAEEALARTAALLWAKGAQVHYFDFAEAYNDDRKPNKGMAVRLEQELDNYLGLEVDWDKSYMVGDAGWKKDSDTEPDGTAGEDFSNSDRKFAEALNITYHHPRDFFGWIDHDVRNFHKADEVEQFIADNPDFGD